MVRRNRGKNKPLCGASAFRGNPPAKSFARRQLLSPEALIYVVAAFEMNNESEKPNSPSPALDPQNSSGSGAATEPQTFTAEEIEELKARAAKADEHWERLLRQAADFENYKKRVARERSDATKYAAETLLKQLIPIIDNFEMALAAVGSGDNVSAKSLQTGITMIYNQLRSTLADAGLEEIDAAHQPFDPNLHEAVSHQESTEVADGHVVQQLRRGYKLRDRLLRPATVIVAKKPAA
jgi:molecular chaperone GrpE